MNIPNLTPAPPEIAMHITLCARKTTLEEILQRNDGMRQSGFPTSHQLKLRHFACVYYAYKRHDCTYTDVDGVHWSIA